VFKGIPYANTPTRWLHAEPKSKWNDTLDATKFGDACMQYWDSPRHGNMSEDCLFLNVWTPRNISALVPVVIFIHGTFVYKNLIIRWRVETRSFR
jgi:para-nitrobenzyl esterase